MYSAVLMNAMLIGVMGLSALTVVRIERRSVLASEEMLRAKRHAHAAVELALLELNSGSSWRTSFQHGVESTPQPFSEGQLSWRLFDAGDGNLGDDIKDDVLIQGIGRAGDALWVEAVEAFPPISPLDALKMAMHVEGRLSISSSQDLTATGAPVSTNGELRVDGRVRGDAECVLKTGSGSVSGSLKLLQPAKPMPADDLFDMYIAMATTLPYQGDFDKDLLAPGKNTYAGGLNTDGVYYLNTGSNQLTIKGTRINGTLLVKGDVLIDDSAFLHPFRSNYPALIVDGKLTIKLKSYQHDLRENSWSTNFNASGAPYQGSTDSDQGDNYPNEVQGLVHVLGDLEVDEASRLIGCLICEGKAAIKKDLTIQHDPLLFQNPPYGYTTVDTDTMTIVPGSWKRASY